MQGANARDGPQRIVVLGGGMASLVTAFELTRTPELRRRHQVTVIQHGHLLGGKGASAVNLALSRRVEEHGLHVLYGFYENVFRVLRECYDELGRAPGTPLATWQEAVASQDVILLPQNDSETCEWWPLLCPPNAEVPGDGGDLVDPWRYVVRVLEYAALVLGVHRSEELPRGLKDAIESRSPSLLRQALTRVVLHRRRSGELSLAFLARLAARVANMADGTVAHRDALLWVVERAVAALWSGGSHDGEIQRVRVYLDFAYAVVRGILVDGLVASPPRWFDIDDEDFYGWLQRHGARMETLESPLVRGLVHAAFAVYEPIGAGTMLHAALRMVFTYKGAILYRLQAGMGETVFAPLYEVLRRRGVRFCFFRSVQRLELSPARTHIARIVVQCQATVRTVDGEYDPLVDVDGLPCWPSEPLFDQLAEGDELRAGDHDLGNWWDAWPGVGQQVLEAGRDFDTVVLGISLAALPAICEELIDDPSNPRFRAMVERVRTTQTQAAQLWFDPSGDQLSWRGPAHGQPPIVIPFALPFDTWADMSHLLEREQWPDGQRPERLNYVCAPLDDDEPVPGPDDHDYPKRQRQRVEANLTRWLEGPGRHVVGAPEGERLDRRYVRATVHPSDRYVLSVPGSVRCRLRAGESGYPNLVLAGDWTKTALSLGCIEAATMSGFAAARAIDGDCRRACGDWLPDPVPDPDPAPSPDDHLVSSRLPPYLSHGQLIARPPIRMHASLRLFVLDASMERLARMCDRYLNLAGSPTQYRPLGPHVVLYCSSLDRQAPIEDPIGWCPEVDFGFWVPVIGRDGGGRQRHVVFTPWIWVDHPVALTGGREVFGFGKELARLRMPEDSNCTHSVDACVLPTHGPDRQIVERRLLTVTPDVAAAPSLRGAVASGGNAVLADGVGLVKAAGLPAHYVSAACAVVRQRALRMVFLKQFPDAVDASRACYQAIVEAAVRITSRPHGGLLPGGYRVTIGEYASHPIVESLGLRTERRSARASELVARLALRASFDAEVEPGEVVYDAVAGPQ